MENNKVKSSSIYDMLEVKVNDSHPHAYKPHLHSELSIGIIDKGKTRLTINDMDYELCEGEAVIIMPYVVHNCQPLDINNWAFTMIYLDDSFRDELTASIGNDLKIGITKLGTKEFKLIKNLANTLKSENDDFIKEIEIIDCINEIIESIEVKVYSDMDSIIEQIRCYIKDNFLASLSLDELSKSFDMNKFKLIRRFKKIYDSTPSAYQLQLKVDYAKQLMKHEKDLVAISLKAGFYDQAHFSKEFKKATGITPRQYALSEGISMMR
ncbi:AraC-type DNA-binding protein [Dethiosulfatibacter aminovorans DSM 17477]|uniref:AraC-type DNA-binding protein n=1 Tax=Dethiosulfatibacter aminovorans DSM 17477 TaxID=1121476 RepID=A0A1M6MH13_9FIRM|nr:AraC family transcriptional regulator [Dethiosulfatibacter aminovorans]SHJ82728.1 AraC-type DNA-binding protein [Dethiosulfatibacter aminovorans DSM 17477]